jgi:hypothetical protein
MHSLHASTAKNETLMLRFKGPGLELRMCFWNPSGHAKTIAAWNRGMRSTTLQDGKQVPAIPLQSGVGHIPASEEIPSLHEKISYCSDSMAVAQTNQSAAGSPG